MAYTKVQSRDPLTFRVLFAWCSLCPLSVDTHQDSYLPRARLSLSNLEFLRFLLAPVAPGVPTLCAFFACDVMRVEARCGEADSGMERDGVGARQIADGETDVSVRRKATSRMALFELHPSLGVPPSWPCLPRKQPSRRPWTPECSP